MYNIYSLVRNIRVNKRAYILYSTVVLLVIAIVIPLVAIMTTIREEITNEAQLHGNQVTIQRNPQYSSEQDDSTTELQEGSDLLSVLIEFSNNEYVKSVTLQQYIKVYSNNLEINDGNLSLVQEVMPYNYRLMTNTSTELNKVAKQFGINITRGHYPKNSSQILVPSSLLSSLDLEIGDELTIQLSTLDYYDDGVLDTNTEEEYKCEIVGAYKLTADSTMPTNTIITNLESFSSLVTEKSDIKATYYLDDYKHVNNFINTVNNLGLPSNYYINIHASELSNIIDPLNAMVRKLSNVIIIITIISVGLVLIIGLVLLKKRKQEIHLSRLFGENKSDVCVRIAEEIVVISVLVGAVSIVIGKFMIVPVTKILIIIYHNPFINLINLEELLVNSEVTTVDLSSMSLDQIVDKLDPHIDILAIIVSLAIIALLGIVFISVFVNYINKYEVKNLLKEKNANIRH